MKTIHIHEHVVSNKRLGRHVEHDPRSRAYAFKSQITTGSLRSVHHRRYGKVFDQGNLGSCTGNAAAGIVNTVPLHLTHHKLLTEDDAVKVYGLATELDGFDGTYPPDDTGSSGLAAAQALKQLGYITEYQHAFSLEDAVGALQVKPVITGVSWYEGFDNPVDGLVKIAGQIRGGHEFEILGFEWHRVLNDSLVVAQNSWGDSWGIKGRFKFTVATWKELLDQDGDVTVF